MLFCSLAFMLLNLFKARTSFCLTRCSIFLAEHLKCVCTQVTIKVDVFIQKNMYPIRTMCKYLWWTTCSKNYLFPSFLKFCLGCCNFLVVYVRIIYIKLCHSEQFTPEMKLQNISLCGQKENINVKVFENFFVKTSFHNLQNVPKNIALNTPAMDLS